MNAKHLKLLKRSLKIANGLVLGSAAVAGAGVLAKRGMVKHLETRRTNRFSSDAYKNYADAVNTHLKTNDVYIHDLAGGRSGFYDKQQGDLTAKPVSFEMQRQQGLATTNAAWQKKRQRLPKQIGYGRLDSLTRLE